MTSICNSKTNSKTSIQSSSQPRQRPSNWATEIINSELDNFYKIDQGVYRSKQPDEETFTMLQKMGIKEVLNLRRHHSDTDEAEDSELTLHRIKIKTGSITENQLIQALSIIQNRKGPIVFHCWHGSDRTGAVAATYRIVFNGWSKLQAIDELRNGGYGYHAKIYRNIVELLENLDVKHIKHQLGLNVEQEPKQVTQ
ncbi:MAG: tyrosine-protein phosphatase [Proteobacteria bacterium]|nr:tyrosine-protein phosphatase [Pseudomonadota bacterium]